MKTQLQGGEQIAFKRNIKITLKQKKLHTFVDDSKYFLRIYLKITDQKGKHSTQKVSD